MGIRNGHNGTTRFILFTAILAFTACHKSNPVAPDAPLAGSWVGTITDRLAGTGNLRLTMAQDGGAVTGDWTATFTNTANNRSGKIVGTALNTTILLSLTSGSKVDCGNGLIVDGTLTVTATLADTHLTGTYVVFVCSPPGVTDGSIDVTRS